LPWIEPPGAKIEGGFAKALVRVCVFLGIRSKALFFLG
jgi:hypothetical protein